MDSIEDVISRAANAPVQHCGGKWIALFDSYLFGYKCARQRHGAAFVDILDDLEWSDRAESKVTLTPEHSSRLNALSFLSMRSYAQLTSADRYDSIDTWIHLREEAIEKFHLANIKTKKKPFEFNLSLGSFIPLIRKRPGMYFGTNDCAEQFWAFVNGWVWAESDLKIANGEASIFMPAFQTWIGSRYPFARNISWGRLFALNHIGSGRDESEYCFEHIEMFLHGDFSSATGRKTSEILRNILKHAKIPVVT